MCRRKRELGGGKLWGSMFNIEVLEFWAGVSFAFSAGCTPKKNYRDFGVPEGVHMVGDSTQCENALVYSTTTHSKIKSVLSRVAVGRDRAEK